MPKPKEAAPAAVAPETPAVEVVETPAPVEAAPDGSPGESVETPPPAAPAPSAPSVDPHEMARIFSEGMRGGFQELAQALRPPPAATPLPEDIADEELDRAVLNGERPAAVIKRAIKAQVAQARAEIQSELANARTQVTQTLEQLSRQTIASAKHYDRLRPEIDRRLATLPPDARANPEVVRHVYNIVRGEQADTLEAEAVEAARRQARATAAPTPGTGQARPGNAVASQDWRELFSAEEQAAINMKKGGIEATARSLGYRSTEEYLAKRRQQGGLQ